MNVNRRPVLHGVPISLSIKMVDELEPVRRAILTNCAFSLGLDAAIFRAISQMHVRDIIEFVIRHEAEVADPDLWPGPQTRREELTQIAREALVRKRAYAESLAQN